MANKKKPKLPTPYSEAQKILKKHTLITPNHTKKILYYVDGIYKQGGEDIIRRELLTNNQEHLTRYFIFETLNIIQIQTLLKQEELNKEHLIFLNNGIYNINTNRFKKFSEKEYSTKKLKVNYNSKSKCPKFKEFLKEILTETDIPTVQEIFGYCLLNSTKYHKAVMMLGEGSNGKSTLLDVLIELLGNDNVSSISLQEIGTNRFVKSVLKDKLANIFPDLPASALKDSSMFKLLVAGDKTYCDVKFKEGYEFRNKAKLIFSANRLPMSSDDSHAFFRRWLLINFPYTFDESNRDVNKLKKLTTNEELSGVFNWSIIGLKRLLKNNTFSDKTSSDEIREQYIKLSDSLQAFVNERVEPNYDSDGIGKESFYRVYKMYCEKSKLVLATKDMVGKRLPQLIKTQTVRKMAGDDREYRWSDIQFKNLTKSEKSDIETNEKQTDNTGNYSWQQEIKKTIN